MGMGMGTGKFTREDGWKWGFFCGDGMGMGTILFTVSLSSSFPAVAGQTPAQINPG